MYKRFLGWPGSIFVLVFAWQFFLFIFSAQPVPANDSFFYDGAVVNLLRHGKYVNPCLALALPISGTEVYSAYPPLYQLALLGWMGVCGTSALAAMAFHLVLFGAYLVILWAILRTLQTPGWCVRLAGAFLFVLTFHDRPDSVAHVFGVAAVYGWVRWRAELNSDPQVRRSRRWLWLMAFFVVLTLGTSLQIGTVYFILLWIGLVLGRLWIKDPLPVGPMLWMVLAPLALVALVVFRFPHLWTGFLEHARQTPSLIGWHLPRTIDVLKVIRTVPGVLAAVLLLPRFYFKPPRPDLGEPSQFLLTGLACSLATMAVVAGCLLAVSPNLVVIGAYLQPIIVASFLAWSARRVTEVRRLRAQTPLFVALALLGAVRAVGMTTWGLVCATDFGYGASLERVRDEMSRCVPGQTVVASSAYLYETTRHDQARSIHSDWLRRARRGQPNSEHEALLELKPAKLILTQFDYFRRYEEALTVLRLRPGQVQFQIVNTARVPAPDSIPSLQRIVQHISWAPVIVTFVWPKQD